MSLEVDHRSSPSFDADCDDGDDDVHWLLMSADQKDFLLLDRVLEFPIPSTAADVCRHSNPIIYMIYVPFHSVIVIIGKKIENKEEEEIIEVISG